MLKVGMLVSFMRWNQASRIVFDSFTGTDMSVACELPCWLVSPD
jgi:hypothetical protein